MLLYVHIMIRAWVAHVYVYEQLVMVHNDRVVHCINVFLPIKPCVMHPKNFRKCVPNVTFYLGVGHWIHNQVHY
jgi:hypothetical protein